MAKQPKTSIRRNKPTSDERTKIEHVLKMVEKIAVSHGNRESLSKAAAAKVVGIILGHPVSACTIGYARGERRKPTAAEIEANKPRLCVTNNHADFSPSAIEAMKQQIKDELLDELTRPAGPSNEALSA